MVVDVVSISNRQTSPCLPLSRPWRPPSGFVKERKRVTKSALLSALTARPRGWKCRWRSGSLQRLSRMSTLPISLRVTASMTVIVSCALLATNKRLPSGDMTRFHGSAPVLIVLPTTAAQPAQVALRILITVTELLAALATKMKLLPGSTATLRGSLPTWMVARIAPLAAQSTDSVSSRGLITNTRRSFRDSAIGLELVGAADVAVAISTGIMSNIPPQANIDLRSCLNRKNSLCMESSPRGSAGATPSGVTYGNDSTALLQGSPQSHSGQEKREGLAPETRSRRMAFIPAL